MSDERGSADPFPRSAGWDAGLAGDWAARLDQRAGEDMQVRLRRRLCELAAVRPGDQVVELGCGTGHLLLDLAEAAGPDGRVTGVEPQAVLADQARDRVAGRPTVAVHVGPAEKLPLCDQSVDAVLAQTVLVHLPATTFDAVLDEVRRVLKPGGRFVSADQDAESRVIDHPDRETTRAIIRYNTDQQFAEGWLGRRLPRLLREAGFSGVTAEAYAYVTTDPDLHELSVRYAQAAVDGGAISAAEGERWVAQLTELAASGSYLSGITYYVSVGVR